MDGDGCFSGPYLDIITYKKNKHKTSLIANIILEIFYKISLVLSVVCSKLQEFKVVNFEVLFGACLTCPHSASLTQLLS